MSEREREKERDIFLERFTLNVNNDDQKRKGLCYTCKTRRSTFVCRPHDASCRKLMLLEKMRQTVKRSISMSEGRDASKDKTKKMANVRRFCRLAPRKSFSGEI